MPETAELPMTRTEEHTQEAPSSQATQPRETVGEELEEVGGVPTQEEIERYQQHLTDLMQQAQQVQQEETTGTQTVTPTAATAEQTVNVKRGWVHKVFALFRKFFG